MPLRPGHAFAGYRIVRLLGSGGMGEVYLAEHPNLPRQDALKILGADISANEEYRQRFIREADLAAKLWHPNIVRVNDRGEYNGQLWIAMDYVDGTDAASLLRDRYPAGMPADEVAAIITAIASALDYAHQRGLLHRDVKPANILLANPEDDEQRILLGDFGIARIIGDISGLTATNMTVGTLPYAAPEQLMDDPMDGRADQYALAATAYHLLTGSPVFPQSNPAAVISRHLNTPPPAMADSHPELAALDPVLARALAKDPADRFARCIDFARAFAHAGPTGEWAAAAAPTAAAPSSRRAEPVRPKEKAAVLPLSQPAAARSRRLWFMAAAAATVLVLAAATLVWHPWRESQPATTSSAPPLVIPSANPSNAPHAASPPSSQTASAAPVALPDVPPEDAGCPGTVTAHQDIQHQTFGAVRVFLLRSTTLGGQGCIAAVTSSGKTLPPTPITVSAETAEPFGFANPATDATGNIFVQYNPGRYDGVLVLIPNSGGFENIGWDTSSSYTQHFMGKHAYYYAQVVGPGADGEYMIRQSHNDCIPDCASGTVTTQDLHWNGSDYVLSTG